MEKNPIPSDKTRYDEFKIVEDRTDEQVRKLVEQASNNTSAKEDSLEWKVGRFYSMGMDKDSINRQGIEPLRDELNRIDNMSTASDVQKVSAHLLSYYIIDPLLLILCLSRQQEQPNDDRHSLPVRSGPAGQRLLPANRQ